LFSPVHDDEFSVEPAVVEEFASAHVSLEFKEPFAVFKRVIELFLCGPVEQYF
jgi:hypothetical protein